MKDAHDIEQNEYLGDIILNKEYSTSDGFVQVFDDVIKKEVCKDIIEVFEKNKESHQNGVTAGGYNSNIKNTKEMYLRFGEPLFKFDDIIFEGLKNSRSKYINYLKELYSDYDYSDSRGGWDEDLGDTGYQLQKYIKNEGRYKWHTDNSNSLSYITKYGIRKYAFIFYLNDVEEGGETGFIIDSIKNTKPKAGRVLIFPTTDQYVHCGIMPKSNDKYMITGWLHTKNEENK